MLSSLLVLSIIVIGALVLAFHTDFIGSSSNRADHRSAEHEASRRTPTRKY